MGRCARHKSRALAAVVLPNILRLRGRKKNTKKITGIGMPGILDDAGIGRGRDHRLDGLGMDNRRSGKFGRVDVTFPERKSRFDLADLKA